VFFFFQAEDGIRDFHVTGVQTCALPICEEDRRGAWRRDQFFHARGGRHLRHHPLRARTYGGPQAERGRRMMSIFVVASFLRKTEIGRASCREECSTR